MTLVNMQSKQKESNRLCEELQFPLYLIWFCGAVITFLAAILIIADFNTDNMLLISSCAQTFFTIMQIIVTFRLKLCNKEYTPTHENESAYCVTIGSQFVFFLVNVIIASVRNSTVEWYVFLMIFMPLIIFSVTAGIYGIYVCRQNPETVTSNARNNKPELKSKSNSKPKLKLDLSGESLSESSSETLDDVA